MHIPGNDSLLKRATISFAAAFLLSSCVTVGSGDYPQGWAPLSPMSSDQECPRVAGTYVDRPESTVDAYGIRMPIGPFPQPASLSLILFSGDDETARADSAAFPVHAPTHVQITRASDNVLEIVSLRRDADGDTMVHRKLLSKDNVDFRCDALGLELRLKVKASGIPPILWNTETGSRYFNTTVAGDLVMREEIVRTLLFAYMPAGGESSYRWLRWTRVPARD